MKKCVEKTDHDMELFFDIASFFNGFDRDYVVMVLDSMFFCL